MPINVEISISNTWGGSRAMSKEEWGLFEVGEKLNYIPVYMRQAGILHKELLKSRCSQRALLHFQFTYTQNTSLSVTVTRNNLRISVHFSLLMNKILRAQGGLRPPLRSLGWGVFRPLRSPLDPLQNTVG